MGPQFSELSEGVDIIIATPGRLKDHLNKGTISLKKVSTVIMDEADRMLDLGFEPQIKEILGQYDLIDKKHRQNVMFSATFTKEVLGIASNFLNDYYYIGNSSQETYTINKKIIQELIFIGRVSDKFDDLAELLKEKFR